MVEFRFNIDFRVDLLFWTNLSGGSAPTGDPVDRLYSTVQTNLWTVRFQVHFDPVTGNPIGAVPPVALTMARDANPTRRALRVEGTGLETRHPVALNLFSVDARS